MFYKLLYLFFHIETPTGSADFEFSPTKDSMKFCRREACPRVAEALPCSAIAMCRRGRRNRLPYLNPDRKPGVKRVKKIPALKNAWQKNQSQPAPE